MLKIVGTNLTDAGLTINMQKSKFCYKELKYLGYIVGGGKLKPDSDKIADILNIKPPKTPKEVRKFLGTVGWYRRFIENFSTLTAPITDHRNLFLLLKLIRKIKALFSFKSNTCESRL